MRILAVDDHALVRAGVAAVVHSVDPSIELLQAGTCAEGLALALAHPPDLVLLDLQLPDVPGMQALERFRAALPERPVVVVSGQEDRDTVLRALDLGALAFIPKSADQAVLADALRTLLAGRIYLPRDVIEGGILPKTALATPGLDIALTDRQHEVLTLLAAGLSNKHIARKLDIAESTVKIHVSAIMRAFKVASRTQVLIAVARSGLRLRPA